MEYFSAVGIDLSSLAIASFSAIAAMFALAVSYFTSSGGVHVGQLDLTQHEIAQIIGGAIKGSLHLNEISAIEACVDKSTTTFDKIQEDLLNSIGSFTKKSPNVMDIVFGVQNLGKSFTDLGVIVNNCETEIQDSVEMDLFRKMTNMFMNTEIKDIALTVGKNIVVSGVDVYRELSAAYTNFFAKQYEQFGIDIGAAFALVFIGPAQVNKLSENENA